ncbi:hypothetical protein JHJ32_07560 [Parapedobacter sp. ISTM3]|uniref:hypothetical protein n=1 Tax=Parapedobacter sp. ISTM3 TaxID=2800130 RepID=UPI001903A489|nr:hypothetical protein [Parapedobacter sp. ISTM3]MBK1439835.1 hypothetical protein [Parapedobacter sp. ISTM3]
MKMILMLAFMTLVSLTAFAQDVQRTGIVDAQDQSYSYAYISVEGKLFSKKLKVGVDFGDTPEQLKAGEEYSKKLTNKKSYAAILNYMVENQFELVETLDFTSAYNGTGGTSGIVFIMRKKK